jgi:Protein of unknown function (DUF3500)
MNRRTFLKTTGLVGSSLVLSGPVSLAQNASDSGGMTQAARVFLERAPKAGFAFSSPMRTAWHWFPERFYPDREGARLGTMTAQQREAALALLRSSTAERGYQKALNIIALSPEINNDPGAYFFSVYGTPGSSTWGWSLEGHHLSLNYTISGERVVAAPIFLGASPTTVLSGRQKGLRAMPREEDAARELMRSLNGATRAKVIFDADTPGDTITRNAVRVSPLERVGINVSELSGAQRNLIVEILREYTSVMPRALSVSTFERASKELERAQFAWAGALEARQLHYYRLQTLSFLLEHDNSRDSGTHIHSVWREFKADFGIDL